MRLRPCVSAVLVLLTAGLLAPPVAGQTFAPAGTNVLDAFPDLMAGFGGALAVVDEEVIIGEGANSLRSGIVYVYRRDGDGSWSEAHRLTADDAHPGDGFGTAIAHQDGRLLIGAIHQSEGRGAAFLFQRTEEGEWGRIARLEAEGMEPGAVFAGALALSGNEAFVAAPRHDDDRGTVLVFKRGEDGEWRQVQALSPENSDNGDLFGASVAVAGESVLVGAPGHANRTGTVHVFRRDGETGEWRAVDRLSAGGLQANNRFGSDVTTTGTTALISAPQAAGGAGVTYLFQLDEGEESWSEAGRLVAFDGSRNGNFGASVAASEDGEDGTLWVGAPRLDQGSGATYVFEGKDGEWRRATRIQSSDAQARAQFGGSVAVAGSVAAVGLAGADNSAGKVSIFERDDSGSWLESSVVYSEPEALPAVAGETLECEDDDTAGIFPCSNVEVLAFLPVHALGGDRGIRLNDVWGWQDPETGREYALVGRTDGMAFVDISDRNNPVYVGELPKTEGSPTAAWRDMKVYRNHMFVVADASGQHGMQIFDLTRLREFAGDPITFDPNLTYDRIHSAHNIVVNEETGHAFTVGNSAGGETCGGGLHMIDITEPLSPTFVGCFADPQTGRASTGYTHDAQCVIYQGPQEAYRGREICFGANETALSIADVTDKDNPVALSRAAYPNVGYSHQVWLTEDHEYLYMNDELDVLSGMVDRTRTIIWDVTDLEDPQVAGEYFSPVSASAHNIYIVGDLMYQSNYASGLRIVDISDRENPEEVGYLDTAPYADPEPGFTGSWSNFPFFEDGTVAVTSIQEGLYLVRYAPRVPVS